MEALDEKSHEEKICKTPFEDIFKEKQLKLLRFSTCDAIFMTILRNYIDSLSMKVVEEDHLWVVDDYEVAIRQERLFCACGYSVKCGVPYTHIIKLIFQLHEDILNYVHNRWKIEKTEGQPKYVVKRGRPRYSRRNRK